MASLGFTFAQFGLGCAPLTTTLHPMFLSLPPFWASWLPAPLSTGAHDVSHSFFPSLGFGASLACASQRLKASLSLAPLAPLRPAELRIDVHTGPDAIEQELQSLHDRLHTPGDSMHGIERLPLLSDPRFIVHYREADGERYVYIEDKDARRLAGYTVFNRLIEVNKRADRLLRAPHSKFAPEYQRQGLATAVYRWALDDGQCLMTGARQSSGAHALWERLARDYPQGYVHVQDKVMTYLGYSVDNERLMDDLNTRRILLGRGWSMAGLVGLLRMRYPEPFADAGSFSAAGTCESAALPRS
ncbi:hypothetical protein SDC9_76227 [bioreactor metagenome]|uniref:Uncharacterized protein n=1 Tax=bioreactor metagenome TaxID=1076179 RepID=A0A644YN27_9ZZZZ